MITYPFKFKTANKYLPAEAFSLILPLILNLRKVHDRRQDQDVPADGNRGRGDCRRVRDSYRVGNCGRQDSACRDGAHRDDCGACRVAHREHVF